MSSHRPRAAETRTMPPNSANVSIPRIAKSTRPTADNFTTRLPQRTSITSVSSSSGRRSSGSMDSSTKSLQIRPSALPRSTSASSQTKPVTTASSRPAHPASAKVTSNAVPRPSATAKDTSAVAGHRTAPTQEPSFDFAFETFSPQSIEGDGHSEMDVSQKRRSRSGFTLPVPAGPLPPRLIPELQALAAASNRAIPPPPSSSLGSIMSSPSTVFTTSPSPWSASTTTTTPVSWSSTSPGIVQPTNPQPASKRSQTVPVPATIRTKLPRLPVLKENQPPSSSSSKIDTKEESKSIRKKLKKTPLNSPAPTPPPRSSSARSRSNSKSSVQSKQEPENLPPVPTTEESPLAKHTGLRVERIGQNLDAKSSSQGHSRLQEAINLPPSRPSRDGLETVGLRTHTAVNTNMLHNGTRRLMDAAPVGQTSHRRATSGDEAKRKVEPEKETQKQSARSRLAKFSKIALFGRSRETNNTDTTKPLPPRKGPVAGTGHEGYGRFGRKTRKGSIGSNTVTTDGDAQQPQVPQKDSPPPPHHQRKESGKSSRRTSSSQSELDDFASTRMKPVVLKGGSQKSPLSAGVGFHLPTESSDISVDSYLSSNIPPSRPGKLSSEYDSPPKSRPEQRPTLAQRRSQKFSDANEVFRLPDPIETKNLAAPPCLDSQNTSYSSDIPTSAPYGDYGTEMHRMDPHLADQRRKKSRKLKWNVFSKKDEISGPIPIPKPLNRSTPESEVPVSVSAIAVPKAMPYYAMIGSDSEIMTTETIGEYLNEAAESPKFEDIDSGQSQDGYSPIQHRAESILLPSAPERKGNKEEVIQILEDLQPLFTATAVDSPHDSDFNFPLPPQTGNSPSKSEPTPTEPEQPKPRQPRLAQVGRIPKVIPRSQQADAVKQESRGVPIPPINLVRNNEHTGVTSGKEEPRRRLLPKLATESLRNRVLPPVPEAEGDATPRADTVEQHSTVRAAREDFLRFSDPRNSDFTTSSSSDGIITIMGPSIAATAPMRQSRSHHHDHDDDVWNEYDEFIDRVMSPSELGYDHRQLLTAPATYGVYPPTKLNSRNKGLAIIPPLLAPQGPSQPLPTPPYVFSASPSLKEMSSSEEMRLRRSRIAAALHSSYAPSSPFSMREFIAEYGRRDSAKMSERQSTSTAGVRSPSSPEFIEQPVEADTKHYENASHIDDIERTRNPLKHSELSYASLMVSRALSFGRVLFSPAHTEIETQPERHVLVIDGLGNEDWSIYCAVTYQSEKAFVHDLKEKRPTRRNPQAARKSDSVPSNHRRAEVSSFTDRFPFPPSFFSVIVLRFPPVMAESKLRNIMSECKRVLAPGGYLELMVLELDIVNMGVLTRRAVKDLKIKMSTSDRDVSLKPIIDNVQTVLGSRGFSNVSQCIVGVPVVGRPVSATGSTSSSRSSGSPIKRSSAGPRPFETLSLQEGFSLNDLVADHSENADAKIGRMVSRTARSWWQHCFEASVIRDGNLAKSIFANKEIMTECKTRASNFKLLIAYTQKAGGENRRRTLSEPTVPTLAAVDISKQQKSTK